MFVKFNIVDNIKISDNFIVFFVKLIFFIVVFYRKIFLFFKF